VTGSLKSSSKSCLTISAKLCRKSRQQDQSIQQRLLPARLLKNIKMQGKRKIGRKVIDYNCCVGLRRDLTIFYISFIFNYTSESSNFYSHYIYCVMICKHGLCRHAVSVCLSVTFVDSVEKQ